VLLGGLIMLVTPGPAFVLIPIGLAMLSLEFVWAERLLEKSLEHAQIAQQKAAQTTRLQRILGAIAGALALAACILAVIWWDIPILPDS
jgi:ferric-dicitrate binding protein FerR (iron transport regulator)